MRQRADLVGVMAEPHSAGSAWRADFAVNVSGSGQFVMNPSGDASRVNCYDVSSNAARLTASAVDLGRLDPDSAVVRLLDSIMTAAGSLAARAIPSPRIPWTRDRLSDRLSDGVLVAGQADGFLCDRCSSPISRNRGTSEPSLPSCATRAAWRFCRPW